MTFERGKPFKPGNPGGPPRWKKGVSGNPGGKPKELTKLRAYALSRSKEVFDRLFELTKHADGAIAERACEAWLDRAGLRPFSHEPEKVDVSGSAVNIAINWKRPNDTGSGSPP